METRHQHGRPELVLLYADNIQQEQEIVGNCTAKKECTEAEEHRLRQHIFDLLASDHLDGFVQHIKIRGPVREVLVVLNL